MITIQQLQKKDIPSYKKLLIEAVRSIPHYPRRAQRVDIAGYPLKTIANRLSYRNNVWLLAKDDSQPVGFVFGSFYAGVFFVEWIGVSKKFRKHGLGRKLLSALENKLRKLGVHKVWLNIDTGNQASVALFKSSGYKFIARLSHHWHDLNCTIWGKYLGGRQ